MSAVESPRFRNYSKQLVSLNSHEPTSSDNELGRAIEDIAKIVHKFGLRPFPTDFQMVTAEKIYELGAYGMPGRFSHWTHGAAYHQMKTMYDYGLSKIYELVINTNPAQAFLLEGNSPTQNKLVAAHVLAHVDFFANSRAFADTNRQMRDTAHLHADRIRSYESQHGPREVEEFLDAALAIQWNIDATDSRRPDPDKYISADRERFEEEQKRRDQPPQTQYEDIFELGEEKEPPKEKPKVPFPAHEEQDLLWFIASFAPHTMEDWKRDIIEIVRSEAQYFSPQARTKIMNEGWATLWHARILREMGERGKLKPGEDIAWPQLHSSVATPSRTDINPYYVGWKIWEDIERKGKGEPHPEGKKEKNWRGEELPQDYFKGREEYDISWVREHVTSDEAFIRSYLTPNLIENLDLYVYAKDAAGNWIITDKDPNSIRERLVQSLVNMGQPTIRVAVGGGDYKGNRELYLRQKDDRQIDEDWAKKTLPYIRRLWGRAAHLEANGKDGKVLLSCEDETKATLSAVMK